MNSLSLFIFYGVFNIFINMSLNFALAANHSLSPKLCNLKLSPEHLEIPMGYIYVFVCQLQPDSQGCNIVNGTLTNSKIDQVKTNFVIPHKVLRIIFYANSNGTNTLRCITDRNFTVKATITILYRPELELLYSLEYVIPNLNQKSSVDKKFSRLCLCKFRFASIHAH